ncbi:MAG TPA: choice-of-anchor D domain-containing protein [Acidimicrobiales bacterium]|jgi:hypothetical protein|nr:choice-of-anchor D domain-containing protein [Acidimicrobiales bacterium]
MFEGQQVGVAPGGSLRHGKFQGRIVRWVASASAVMLMGGALTLASATPAAAAPAPVTIAPTSINFGNVASGTISGPVTVTVDQTAAGTFTLAPSDVAVTGPFHVNSVTCGTVVTGFGLENQCQIVVVFDAPTAPGPASGTLTINGVYSGSPTTVPLSGTSVGAAVAVVPGNVDFGPVVDATFAPAEPVFIFNTGLANLHVTSASLTGSTDFTISSNPCNGATIHPGAFCTVQVVFSPQAGETGVQNASLNVTTSNGGTAAAALAGTAVPVLTGLVVSPPTLSFGSDPVGTPSPTATVTVQNFGPGPVTVNSEQVTTDPNDFSVGSACTGQVLAVGGSCSFTVTFNPTSAGVHLGLVTINTAGAPSPTVGLSGFGTLAEAQITPPSPINFNGVPKGTQSAPQTITLTNVGTGPLSVSSDQIVGTNQADFTTQADNCIFATLQPGEFCTVDLLFTPSNDGPTPESASFQFTDNAGSGLQSISLVGTPLNALAGTLTFNPNPVAFNSVAIGATQALTDTVTNSGNAPLTINSVSKTGVNAADFGLPGNTCTGVTLAIGTSCTVQASFTPTTTNPESANLAFNYTTLATTVNQNLPLSGNGSAGGPTVLSFNPNPASFGTVPVNEAATLVVNVTNVSATNATLSPSIVGGNPDFTLVSGADACAGVTLTPGSSCTIGIKFLPQQTATEQDILSIGIGAAGPAQQDQLIGTGVTGTSLQVTPGALNFGAVVLGQQSLPQTVTLVNLGAAPLVLPAVPATIGAINPGDFAIVVNGCASATLNPGQSCNISLVFVPTALGARSALLLVEESSASPNPAQVTLSGVGVPPTPPPPGPPSQGYRLAAADGGVFAFGNAPFFGSTGDFKLNKPVVGIASDPATGGYWEVASDGGIFSFHAPFFGSTGGQHLNQPIVGMTVTPDGLGYWLVAADGGVFAYGDADYFGSMGAQTLNAPVVGMAADLATGGYWLVAADGGVFAFNAPFLGSTGGVFLNKPVVGITASNTGQGYRFVASDGGIFDFGDANFYGSAGNIALNKPVVGMSTTDDGGGYWLVASDGGIFAYGDANFYGSMGGTRLNQPVVGMDTF